MDQHSKLNQICSFIADQLGLIYQPIPLQRGGLEADHQDLHFLYDNYVGISEHYSELQDLRLPK